MKRILFLLVVILIPTCIFAMQQGGPDERTLLLQRTSIVYTQYDGQKAPFVQKPIPQEVFIDSTALEKKNLEQQVKTLKKRVVVEEKRYHELERESCRECCASSVLASSVCCLLGFFGSLMIIGTSQG